MTIKSYCLYRIIVLSILTAFIPIKAFEREDIKFSHISINDGLSQSSVFSVTQDNTGNMWFATYDGVNKFDGYDFTIYRHHNSDSTTIASNITRIVMTDSKGRIWIGTHKGISLYNKETDSFMNYAINQRTNTLVTHIVELSPDQLLVNAGQRLYIFNVSNSTFCDDMLPKELSSATVSAIYKTNTTLYIGRNDGKLLAYSLHTGKLSLETTYEIAAKIQTILLQNLHDLWIGTEGNGLIKLDLRNGKRSTYRHTGKNGDISSDYIRSLAVDSSGHLWVGTFNDLNIYKQSSDTFEVYTNNSDDEGSLSQRSVRCIYKDNQGGMWLGTYFGGLNYHHPLKNRFQTIKHDSKRNSLSDNVISCIVEDENKGLWIGTNDGGLNYYNPSSHHYKLYLFNDRKDVMESESNNVKAICIDPITDLVYVGTHAGGMKIINRRTGDIRHLYINDKTSAANSVYSILSYNENILWVGTLDGLYMFDKKKSSFQIIQNTALSGRSINVMYKDKDEKLWVGCEDGIEIFQTTNGNLTRLPHQLKSMDDIQMVQGIYQGTDGKIWIATRMGLYLTNSKMTWLMHFTTSNGLPNDVIYGIEEDTYHHIWLSTNKGLSRYNPQDGTFRNFTVLDGLQSNQFNTYSHCHTTDGQLYFGGINGITTFRPELLIENPYTPCPVITKLFLFNKEVSPGDETGILKQHISETDTIVLNHSYKSFTLQFVVSNYLAGQHNTFSYKLNGYDEDWINTSHRNVSYSNLPPGTYCFQVKAANNDGRWNKIPKMLYIRILPVWYKTWWAQVFILLGMASAAAFICRYFWVRKQMRVRIDMERKDKIRKEEISQMKMNFFINISHELRTPLSLILAPLQEMQLRSSDKWMKEQLSYVKRNANRLMHIVNQLMDYRRAELGVFKLHVTHVNGYRNVKDCFSFYEKLAHHKSLDFNLISDIEDKEIYVDTRYIELMLNNLLSNAFKYTSQGTITVELTLKDNFLVLSVADTGVGIAKDKHTQIFERFTQLDADHLGSGIGLSLVQKLTELHHGRIELSSEPGIGSSFSIWLPQDLSCYAENEISEDASDAPEAHSVNTREMFFLDSELEPMPEENTEVNAIRGTILVVEDNEEIRHYLKSGLSKMFNVILAENGQEALEQLKEKKVDIVISDVMMPMMDGIRLCKHIKQNLSTSHIPVIMLSAKTDVPAQREAFGMGADDYIPKPFSMTIVIEKIKNMIRTRQRTIEHYSKELEIMPEKITFNAMDEDLLRRAVEIVKSNIDNAGFSTEDFARMMNMSRSNLHLKLKAITGESAIEFIKKIRFSEACRLLREGKHNVAEISSMVGFNTPSYFASSFKKYMGCLPTEYLKRQ